jgi:PAS domain S-box-containing protein
MSDDTLPTRQSDDRRFSAEYSREDSYRLLFESNPNPMWFYDLETLRFLAVNDACNSPVRFLARRISADDDSGYTSARRHSRDARGGRRSRSGVVTYEQTWRHRKHDNTIIYVRITSQTLIYEDRHAELIIAQDITRQQTMQEQLRESEARYRTLLEATFDGIVVHEGGVILEANQGAAAMFGVEPAEMPGTQITAYAAPDSRAVIMQNVKANVEHSYEIMGLRRDGTQFDLEVTGKAHIYHGRQTRVAALRDITGRKSAAAQLRRSEQLFRALTENALDVITILDQGGRVLYESPAVTSMTGYTPAELTGKHVFDLVHPDDAAKVSAEFEYKLRHPGEVVGFGCRLRHRDGTWRHIEGTGVNLLHDPAVGGVVVNSRDVTERKAVEAERDLERRVLDALIDQLPVGVMFRDREGRYTQANRRIAAIIGVEREQLAGLSGDDMVRLTRMCAPDGEPLSSGAELPSTRALEQGEMVAPDERLIKTSAGEVRHVVTTATPIKIDDEIYGSVIVVDDITEQRQVQEQLRQSQKMEAIGRLAGGVAHDFNNLLTAITGYSDLILRRADASQATRSHAEQIRRAADRAAALTQQLLAFSRKQMLRSHVLNLNGIIIEMEEMLRGVVGEDIRLETRLAHDLAFIKADPHQMEQVIVNLAINARDALAAGGTLLIETRNAGINDIATAIAAPHAELAPDRRYCVLIAHDTGDGMSEETRRRIFEPFFTTKEQGKGTGLGLATVYGIVKQSGGHIVVNSEQGHGTTLKFICRRRTPTRPKLTPHKHQATRRVTRRSRRHCCLSKMKRLCGAWRVMFCASTATRSSRRRTGAPRSTFAATTTKKLT